MAASDAPLAPELIAQERLKSHLAVVKANPASIHTLGIGDRIAVALVLNRIDLMPREYAHSVLEAIQRLGPHRLKAALTVQRVTHAAHPAGLSII